MKIDDRIAILEKEIEELQDEIENIQYELEEATEIQEKIWEIRRWIDKHSENTFDKAEVDRAFQLCRENGIALEFVATAWVNRVLDDLKKIIDE